MKQLESDFGKMIKMLNKNNKQSKIVVKNLIG